MNKTHPVSFRLQPELKLALEKAAAADHRSVSSMIEKIVSDWLVARDRKKARGSK